MRERLGEPLTIDELASVAMFSRFHFSRLFRTITGISPGRFLAAVRIQEAKRLLTTTSLTVAAISTSVGYTSLGTFSSRFHRSVGVSPAAYRHRRLEPPPIQQIRPPQGSAVISGEVRPFCPRFAAPIFIGLFPDAIAEGAPASWAVIDRPGPYRLSGVSPGSWYLIAHSLGEWRYPTDDPDQIEQVTAVARYGPLQIAEGGNLQGAEVIVRPRRDVDPPALLSLLDLPEVALKAARRSPERERHPAAGSTVLTSIGNPPRILSDSIGSGTTRCLRGVESRNSRAIMASTNTASIRPRLLPTQTRGPAPKGM
ncbi:Helix-turn-helix domain-containing protein [Micromonospora narathiwatensis]|uniref:Helix-turn-helix domain-containing protein n=1 Tax=Micromonospora narathiwatensis TaxID=299146 RepID=A0A1A8ZS81_9ACTN|nr:Helix-turn-helix domain-containing protein [Micromonospora narathiwatensis]